MNAHVLRHFRRRYLEEHRHRGGDAAAALHLHRLMAGAFVGRLDDQAPFLLAFRWDLHDPAALTPDVMADLLSLTSGGTGSHYTSPDVTDYLARATILPLLSDNALSLSTERLRSLRILDPTCGTGAFLLAALRLLWTLHQRHGLPTTPAEIVRHNLFGLDLQPEAVEICRLRLSLEIRRLTGDEWHGDNLTCGDALQPCNQSFDVILGNPPYVRLTTPPPRTFATRACGDLSALVVEQCYRWTKPGARLGLVLPISHFVTDGFAPLQRLTLRSLDQLNVAFFANRPAQLFAGAQKRVVLLIGRRGEVERPEIATTGYIRWHRRERPRLLERLAFTPSAGFRVLPHSLEKIGSPLEADLLNRLLPHARLGTAVVPVSPHRLYYTRKFSYFLEFFDFVPRRTDRQTGQEQPPTELKALAFRSPDSLHATVAALSSATFFWFWNAIADGRNVNRRDLLAFPFHPEMVPATIRDRLAALGRAYLQQLPSTKWVMRKGALAIECFQPASLKPQLDAIDAVLAELYGFDAAQLRFLVNYDLPYRLSAATGPRRRSAPDAPVAPALPPATAVACR